MSTKAAREALYEQWYDELTVEGNKTLKAHGALVKNSSSAELNRALQARLTKLFELHKNVRDLFVEPKGESGFETLPISSWGLQG